MTEEDYTYTVKCRTCRTRFQVQLFDSREKALFLVDKKDWYCEACKKVYLKDQTAKLAETNQRMGFPELSGSQKMISWAEKIRADLINKVNYLRQSLQFENDEERKKSEKAFDLFFSEWREISEAKWWIDHRNMTVRDISKRVAELSE